MNVRVQWYEHDCEWVTKYCDEHHTRSATVPIDYLRDPAEHDRQIAERAWDEGWLNGDDAAGFMTNPYAPNAPASIRSVPKETS